MKKLLLCMCLLMGLVPAFEAQASVLVEPYIGYHTGPFKEGSTDFTVSGVSYGARAGFQFVGFMAGLDYLSGSWSGKNQSVTNNYTPSDLGIFAGYDFPVLLRAYAEYLVVANNKLSDDTFKGTGIKLGLGFKLLPLLCLNIDYISQTYTKNSYGSLSPNATDQKYGLSVSIPFTF